MGGFQHLLAVNLSFVQVLILEEGQRTLGEGHLLGKEDQIVVDSYGASDKGVAWSCGRFGCKQYIRQF